MNPSIDQLQQWDREHVWHGFTQMAEYEPWIIERGEGNWLIDVEGRRYLDGVSSLWCNVHGHRRAEIDTAIRQQLDQVTHITAMGMSHPTTIRLAKRLVDLAPDGLRHVFFSDDGSTAVEVATPKIALQYWQQAAAPHPPKNKKTRFVALELAYHGDTLGGPSVGGIARFHQVFHPLLFDALHSAGPGYVPPACGGQHGVGVRVLPGVPAPDSGKASGNDRSGRARAHHAGRGGDDRPSAGLPARRTALDPAIRHTADCRRSGCGLRPYRHDDRVRTRGRHARPALPGEGHHRRLSAARRHAGHRPDLGSVPGFTSYHCTILW